MIDEMVSEDVVLIEHYKQLFNYRGHSRLEAESLVITVGSIIIIQFTSSQQ